MAVDKILKLLGVGGGGGDVADLIGSTLGDYVLGRAIGGKDGGKAAALAGLLGGGLGDMFSAISGPKAEQKSNLLKGLGAADVPKGPSGMPSIDALAEKAISRAAGKKGPAPVFKQGEGTLGYADFLVKAGLLDPESGLTNALNTPVGEGLASALVSGLGAALFNTEEDQAGKGSYEARPYGGSKKAYTFGGGNIARMAQGGMIDGQYFPRRNGGISTSEGSGTKDDVPAMLMAGEFVMTKDAMKGLGNGDADLGIQRAYSMMDNLERRANG
jgi:hypothetical protein